MVHFIRDELCLKCVSGAPFGSPCHDSDAIPVMIVRYSDAKGHEVGPTSNVPSVDVGYILTHAVLHWNHLMHKIRRLSLGKLNINLTYYA